MTSSPDLDKKFSQQCRTLLRNFFVTLDLNNGSSIPDYDLYMQIRSRTHIIDRDHENAVDVLLINAVRDTANATVGGKDDTRE